MNFKVLKNTEHNSCVKVRILYNVLMSCIPTTIYVYVYKMYYRLQFIVLNFKMLIHMIMCTHAHYYYLLRFKLVGTFMTTFPADISITNCIRFIE